MLMPRAYCKDRGQASFELMLLLAGSTLAVIVGILIVSGTINLTIGASNDTVVAIKNTSANMNVTAAPPAWITNS